MRPALMITCHVRKKNTAATTAWTARISIGSAAAGSMRSMKSIVTCSSACDTSGSPAKISTSSRSSVISNAPRIGRLKRYRATTSTNVTSIRHERSAEAAMPRTASARRSHAFAGSLTVEQAEAGGLFFRRDLLDLGAELLQRGPGVDALGGGFLDPVLDDRPRALLHLGDERRVGAHDLHGCLLQRVEALLVGRVPRLAVAARRVFIRVLLDDRLVLLGELVPLLLVHEEAERRAVHSAGKPGGLADHRVELEGHDRLEREEHAVGHAGVEQLVGFGPRLHEGRGADGVRHRLGDAA